MFKTETSYAKDDMVELDILVKIDDLPYKIVFDNNNSLNNNIGWEYLLEDVIDPTKIVWATSTNNDIIFMYLNFDFKNDNEILKINMTLYPMANLVEYKKYSYTLEFNEINIKTIFEKYLQLDNYYIILKNKTKIMDILKKTYNETYNYIANIVKTKARIVYCLESILKTIVKIPVITQGRQVLRKYRVPNVAMVFDKLNIDKSVEHLSNLEADRTMIYFISDYLIKNLIDRDVINNSNDQSKLYRYDTKANLHICSKNTHCGKTIGAMYRVLSLVYSGVDIDSICYIVSNNMRKKSLETFWIDNLEPSVGYLLRILNIESFIKTGKYDGVEYVFIDINSYNDTEVLSSLYNIITTENIIVNYVGNTINFDISTLDLYKLYIDDIEFEHQDVVQKSLAELDINTIELDAYIILDNKLSVEFKKRIREKVQRENVANLKKISLDYFDGLEFENTYIILEGSSLLNEPEFQSILKEVRKRTLNNCYIYT